MQALRGRRRWRLAILVVAGFALAGGVAYATIPDSGNVYTGCMLKGVGTIRLIDPALSSGSLLSHCTALETQISWNKGGPTGPQGPPGVKGPTGDKGPAGDKGPNGDPGQAGSAGATGDKGPTGDKGLSGDKGPNGDKGLSGDKGPNGDKGLSGDKGPNGDKGPTGDQGPAGAAGTLSGYQVVNVSFTIAGQGETGAAADCPAGKVVVGGGFNGGHSNNVQDPIVVVLSSVAFTGATVDGWVITVSNKAIASFQGSVQAICVTG